MRDFNGGRPLPLTMTTHADAPPGSGLGSSSTLVVSMVKAFVEWLNLPLGEYDIARLAYDIERIDVGLSGGRQDQYAATFGGFNFMEFHPHERVVVNPLRIKNWILSELEASLLLYFGGVSRDSAKIIDEQSANVKRNDSAAIEAMHALKAGGHRHEGKPAEGRLRWPGANPCRPAGRPRRRWRRASPTRRSTRSTSSRRQAGMRAGKISGAGGGGFMMLLVDPVRRMDVVRALQRRRARSSPVISPRYGTEGWKIY